MSRKDMILISVVINAGILAMLFITAVIYDPYEGSDQVERGVPVVENKEQFPEETLIATASTGDEVDNVLKYYAAPASMPIEVSSLNEMAGSEQKPVNPSLAEEHASNLQGQMIEVKVKQGDRLEKIARANHTTVGAIKRANGLVSERLSIGQVLKIPVKQKEFLASNEIERDKRSKKERNQEIQSESVLSQDSETEQKFKGEPQKSEHAKSESNSSRPEKNEPVYYVIKSGDNPWKIAKQFNVRYDEILRLNQMSEEKARNLKIGDRIRVK